MENRKYIDIRPITESEVKEAIGYCIEQDKRILPEFTHRFKKAYSVKQFYEPTENVDWTTGFWTGELWLNYENSGNEIFKKAAETQIDSFLYRIKNKIDVDHHDMGFLYIPSCVAGYKLTGNKKGREAAILAADQLISRYHPEGEYIQAWGSMNAPENCRLIIDCLLNVPLLYWATEETNDPKYREIGIKHTKTTLNTVVREDFSTWHTYFFDLETGKPSHGATCQGYRDGSAWARGQAWGVYGIVLSYHYTKEKKYIELFKNVTNFFIKNLPSDLIPYWDLEFGDGSNEPRDAASAAIVACGILEMSKNLSKEESDYYVDIARKMLKSLYDNYAVKDDYKASNGLLLHCTYSKRSPYNTCNHYGVDECNTWGDYFYLEALTRLNKNWKMYW